MSWVETHVEGLDRHCLNDLPSYGRKAILIAIFVDETVLVEAIEGYRNTSLTCTVALSDCSTERYFSV